MSVPPDDIGQLRFEINRAEDGRPISWAVWARGPDGWHRWAATSGQFHKFFIEPEATEKPKATGDEEDHPPIEAEGPCWRWRDPVASPGQLPSTGKAGDAIVVESDSSVHVWHEGGWRRFQTVGPIDPGFAIGSTVWPGLSKLTEEAGELLQVLGKIIALGGGTDHWDGSDLRERVREELADVLAAVDFFVAVNDLDPDGGIVERRKMKAALFRLWHGRQRAEAESRG